jgi:hypothetical protein
MAMSAIGPWRHLLRLDPTYWAGMDPPGKQWAIVLRQELFSVGFGVISEVTGRL